MKSPLLDIADKILSHGFILGNIIQSILPSPDSSVRIPDCYSTANPSWFKRRDSCVEIGQTGTLISRQIDFINSFKQSVLSHTDSV